MRIALILILVFLALISCRSFKTPQQIQHYQVKVVNNHVDDSVHLSFVNPLPIHLSVSFNSERFKELLDPVNPLRISPSDSTGIVLPIDSVTWSKEGLSMNIAYDEVRKSDSLPEIRIPFPMGKRYKVMQGYNGSFSHQSAYSRYAVDFAMPVGDTVTAAADGIVVGVTEGHTQWGNDRRLRDYANFVTVFHPEFGIFTQYVHLEKDGAFVEIGDSVHVNQPIGTCGLVGFTSSPHLHFNVLAKSEAGEKIVSIPAKFGEDLPGSKLTKGTWVNRKR